MKQLLYINLRETGHLHQVMDTEMMKLSVWLLLAVPALLSASPLETGKNTEHRNASSLNPDQGGSPEITSKRSMLTDLPPLSVSKLRQKKQVQSASLRFDDGSNLQWATWENSLPNSAVSIYNSYDDRTDYVCKYKCEAGFYTPSKGPYCHYANEKKAYHDSPFEILVNKDNFEILEWRKDLHSSVPLNSVRTCPGEDIHIGKNKYGLGKVSPLDNVFYLPWEGKKYEYKDYEVLTINENIISQKIYDVRYNTDESKLFHYPPEVMHEATISNYECRSVVKTDSMSKTYQVEQSWHINDSIKLGDKTSITAGIPIILSTGIEISTEETHQFSRGNMLVEAFTDTVSLELTTPPNHSCVVKMLRYKYKIDIPFTARLGRTYGNGEVHTMSITGTYDSIQVGEVRAVVDRCEFLDNSKPCN